MLDIEGRGVISSRMSVAKPSTSKSWDTITLTRLSSGVRVGSISPDPWAVCQGNILEDERGGEMNASRTSDHTDQGSHLHKIQVPPRELEETNCGERSERR